VKLLPQRTDIIEGLVYGQPVTLKIKVEGLSPTLWEELWDKDDNYPGDAENGVGSTQTGTMKE
jgi:hypothetical protein